MTSRFQFLRVHDIEVSVLKSILAINVTGLDSILDIEVLGLENILDIEVTGVVSTCHRGFKSRILIDIEVYLK